MKTKDIIVGELYATDQGQKVEVLEVGLHRRIHWDYRTYRSDRSDGVKIRYVSDGRESVVQNREIKRIWSEQVPINDATKAQDAAKKERVNRGNEILRLVNKRLGIDLPETFRGRWGHRGVELSPVVELHLDDLEALLSAIKAEGA